MKKLLIGLAASFLLLASCGTSVQDLHVSIDEVTTVTLGEQYDVVVSIENYGTDDRLLTSIDIGDDYLAGAGILSSTPNYIEEWDFSFLGFQSYDYQMNIAPGEVLQVTYTFEARELGNYEGALDVCIDTESACIFNTIFTSVQ